MSARIAVALALAGFAACTVDEVDFSGKTCPCAEGYTCDTAQNRCVLGTVPDAATDGAGGVSGAGGAGGSGGCAATEKLCNGACVSKSNPDFGCSADHCDPCPVPTRGQPGCASGACAVGSCVSGFGDCNQQVSDGCETELVAEPHCGACDRTCSTSGASATSCQSGSCVPTCNAGRLDCVTPGASEPDDGCETDPTTSDAHCGSCGNSCSTQGVSGGFACNLGICGCTDAAQCRDGPAVTATCDTATNRCICGVSPCAPGETCQKSGPDSVCRCNGAAACAAGETCCASGGCKDLVADPENCGGCGKACTPGQTCVAGSCV